MEENNKIIMNIDTNLVSVTDEMDKIFKEYNDQEVVVENLEKELENLKATQIKEMKELDNSYNKRANYTDEQIREAWETGFGREEKLNTPYDIFSAKVKLGIAEEKNKTLDNIAAAEVSNPIEIQKQQDKINNAKATLLSLGEKAEKETKEVFDRLKDQYNKLCAYRIYLESGYSVDTSKNEKIRKEIDQIDETIKELKVNIHMVSTRNYGISFDNSKLRSMLPKEVLESKNELSNKDEVVDEIKTSPVQKVESTKEEQNDATLTISDSLETETKENTLTLEQKIEEYIEMLNKGYIPKKNDAETLFSSGETVGWFWYTNKNQIKNELENNEKYKEGYDEAISAMEMTTKLSVYNKIGEYIELLNSGYIPKKNDLSTKFSDGTSINDFWLNEKYAIIKELTTNPKYEKGYSIAKITVQITEQEVKEASQQGIEEYDQEKTINLNDEKGDDEKDNGPHIK